jgi:hypothetical protein
MNKALTQKNTLLKNAQAKTASNFFKRVFFPATQERNSIYFSPTLRCFNFFCQRTVLNRTNSASNLNRFLDSVSKLDTTHLRTDRRATDNSG